MCEINLELPGLDDVAQVLHGIAEEAAFVDLQRYTGFSESRKDFVDMTYMIFH